MWYTAALRWTAAFSSDSQLVKLIVGNTKTFTGTNNNYFYNYTRQTAGEIEALNMPQSVQTTWVIRSRDGTGAGSIHSRPHKYETVFQRHSSP